MRRKLVSLAIVLGAAVVAAAATSDALIATPGAAVSELASGASGSAPLSLSNTTSSPIDVASIVPASCSNGVGFAVVGGPLPRSVAAGSALAVRATCTASTTFGMRRCGFDVRDATANVLTSFLGVCETYGSGALTGSAINFGSVNLGASASATARLTNPGMRIDGTISVQLDDVAGVFRVDGPSPCEGTSGCEAPVSLATGSHVDVSVSCHPIANGTATAKLYAVASTGARLSAPIALQCTGATTTGPAISASASTLDVGSVEVLSGSATDAVRIRNVGTTALDIGAIDLSDSGDGAAADWRFVQAGDCATTPCTLDPGGETDLAVTFDPSQLFVREATMTITSNDPLHASTTVTLTGIGLGRTLELAPGTPSMLDLGFVPNGMTAQIPLQLIDRGNKPLADAVLTATPAGPFSTSPANPVAVPLGLAGTTVMLECSPAGIGTTTATTMLTGSAADSLAMPFALTATCHGTDSPLITSPASIELGELHVGDTATPRTIMIKNVAASGTLTLSGNPTLVTPNPSLSLTPPAMLTIPAGGAVALQLAVDTSSEADLGDSIELSDGSHTIQVPITGQITKPAVTAPASIALGTFCVGQPTTASPIALRATGDGTVTLPMAPEMATSPSAFELALEAPLAYPLVLLPGEQAAIEVAPQPSGSAGPTSDVVVWHTDVATAPSPQTTVTAQFLDDGAAIAPVALAFGQVPIILIEPDAQPVTMQNCGASAISITPTIKHPFSIDSQGFPAMLMPAETATFAVGFHPTQPGMFADVLTINLMMGSAVLPELQVHLTGEGVTGTPGTDAGVPSTPQPTSFYDCSCSSHGPIGGWPIVLALIVIVRRRSGSSSPR